MSEELKIIFKYLLDFAKHPEEYNDDMVALLKVEQVELLLAYVDNIIGQLLQEQNITNELEKYCNEEIEDYDKHIKSQYITDIAKEQYLGEKVCFEDMLGKLQELKGDESKEYKVYKND